jgi:MFS family permease
LAVYQAVYALGMIAGPAVGALVVSLFSLRSVFWLAAVSAGLGIVVSLWAGERQLTAQPERESEALG